MRGRTSIVLCSKSSIKRKQSSNFDVTPSKQKNTRPDSIWAKAGLTLDLDRDESSFLLISGNAVLTISNKTALLIAMGSFLSKSTAVRAAPRRQYPKTPSPSTTSSITQPATSQSAGPKYHSKEKASATRSEGNSITLFNNLFSCGQLLTPVSPLTNSD